jgi:predicted short-subunit dehydrogenase-like oxidoreductase (DUF2520 family)
LADALGVPAVAIKDAHHALVDLILVAISDQALPELKNELPFSKIPIFHTAGAVSIEVLKDLGDVYGVLYPLQSIHKNTAETTTVPYIINGNSAAAIHCITSFAQTLSAEVHLQSDEARLKLHLGAVVVNNFTNHLYTLVQDYCRQEKIEFQLLYPLIEETTQRLKDQKAALLQTGPAKRHDIATIDTHVQLLQQYPALEKLYQHFSTSIQTYYAHYL